MSEYKDEIRAIVQEKMRLLEPYGDDRQVTVSMRKYGTVEVRDKATNILIVGFSAPEWRYLMESERPRLGNTDRDRQRPHQA